MFGWDELRERLAAFNLELHPEKTRLIEFGRYASLIFITHSMMGKQGAFYRKALKKQTTKENQQLNLDSLRPITGFDRRRDRVWSPMKQGLIGDQTGFLGAGCLAFHSTVGRGWL